MSPYIESRCSTLPWTCHNRNALWVKPHWKGDIKNFAKWVPRPPFLIVKIVSDKKYLGKTIWSVSLSFIIWYELILKNNERFDTFILFEDQLNVSLKSDCKYFRTYFQMKMVKKIFVRYLPHEGGLWQKCYFLLFFLAQADWPTHKISDLSDPPFMFFANNFANIWHIW